MNEIRDLGALDQPLLVFGGAYGNLQATRALLAEAERRGIPSKRLLCTGDLVAYCADPKATVELIREAGIAVVMGNCEESVGADAEDCGCGFEKGSSCDLLSAQWYRYCVGALDRDAKAWMRGLPRRVTFTLAGRRLAAIHGGVDEINRFVFPTSPADEKRAELRASGAEAVIGGHSGLPFTEILDGRLWHNAGVIGLPANDGTPRVWFSILSPPGRGNPDRAPRARLRPRRRGAGDPRRRIAARLCRGAGKRPLAGRRRHAASRPRPPRPAPEPARHDLARAARAPGRVRLT